MKLSEIKDKTSIEVVRDGEFESLGTVTHNKPKQLGFVEDAEYLSKLLTKSNITCIISTPGLVSSMPEGPGIGISTNPRRTFYEIHDYLAKETDFYWKNFNTEIAASARIHPTAYVAEKNVRIGESCEIGPHVSILENSILENNVIVAAGAVIGNKGLQINRIGNEIISLMHAGGVLLHSRVEIEANCCVQKALFGGFTEIAEDTKLANFVLIGHSVLVGRRCLLAGGAMVMGSTTIGDDVWVGPRACISSDIVIGNGASITIGSVVIKDVAPGQRVTGNFAIDHDKFIAFMRKIR